MTAPTLVVSIHDVSPLTRAPVTSVLAALAAIGVTRTSLLVVPDHHHRAPINADPSFTPWLRDCIAAGHEPVLHGYFHQRTRHPDESTRTRLVTRIYTAGEGEFFDITAADALPLLLRGREELAQCAGIQPTGFIAPAWLLNAEAETAVRDLGFQYTTRLKAITHLPSGRIHHSQSLCWSVRAPWRRLVSLAWNQFLFASLRPNPLLRVSIHPPDITHPKIWRQIQTLITHAVESREPISYCDFITRWQSG